MSNPHSGNNRKSRRQHELAGTYRKDRHADLISPSPPQDAPEPPGELDPEELAEWERMITRLELSQSLFRVDDLSIYECTKLVVEVERVAARQASLETCVERLEDNLADFKGEDFIKLIQEMTQQQKLISRCTDQLRSGRLAVRQYLVEFGLTPASRSRVKLPPKPAAADQFTTFQQQRGAA